MSFKNVNRNVTQVLMSCLSESDVCTFGEIFPELREDVNYHWLSKRELCVDDILAKDVNKVLKNLALCKQLVTLTFTLPRIEAPFKQFLSAVIRVCPNVEVLNIPGIMLPEEELILLSSSCFNLKSITLTLGKYKSHKTHLELLYLNNPGLESVTLIGPCVMQSPFLRLPRALKKLTIISDKGDAMHDDSVLNAIEAGNLQLEELSLSFNLCYKQLARLTQQKSLKTLHISVRSGDDVEFETLFNNTPQLENVSIANIYRWGFSITSLPKTLKHLYLCKYFYLRESVLLNCLKRWNLVSLNIPIETKDPLFMQDFVAALPSLQHLTLYCSKMPRGGLKSLSALKQLRTLVLMEYAEFYPGQLKAVVDSCSNLYLLEFTKCTFDYSVDLFVSLVKLPKLAIFRMRYPMFSASFDRPMHILSQSRSLMFAEFINCHDFSDQSALNLIRRSSILSEVTLVGNFGPNLLAKVNEMIAGQKDRNSVLRLSVQYREDISNIKFHRFLEVNLI